MTTPNSEPITGPGITWAMEQLNKRFDSSMKKEPVEQSTVETQNNSTPRSQHTPGPWKVIDRTTVAGHSTAPRINMESPPIGGGFVCTLGCPPMGNREANARLIAAAPELLQQLKNVTMGLKVCQVLMNKDSREVAKPVIEAAEAAIAKAEGKAE